LSQLRAVLQDPLFVRVGGRLQPTAIAVRLGPPVEELYEQLEKIFHADTFQPEQSERKFVIASSDILINSLGPRLVKTLRKRAPGMSLHFVDVGRGLPEDMAAREIDFAILPDFAVAALAPAPLRFVRLGGLAMATVLMNPDHPLASKTSVSLQEIADFKQIGFLPDSVLLRSRPPHDTAAHGLTVVVSQHLTVPFLLPGTDLLAVVPKLVAEDALRNHDLVSVELDPPYEISIGLAWSPVFDGDPSHKWFRSAVAEPTQAGQPAAASEEIGVAAP
jgi:DNA-binding transcriptional LysR family regulator